MHTHTHTHTQKQVDVVLLQKPGVMQQTCDKPNWNYLTVYFILAFALLLYTYHSNLYFVIDGIFSNFEGICYTQ